MEERVLFTVEIPMRCSPNILFEFLATPSGLQEWFADKVDNNGEQFSFTWEGVTDEAELVEKVENEKVKFRWDYYDDGEFFEFKISQSPVTNETILSISDFADSDEVEDQKMLWESQINDLKYRIGS